MPHEDIPRARVTQPWLLPFKTFTARYGYFIDAVIHCMHARLHDTPDVTVDWPGVKACLERHMYATSASRYRRFVLLK